MAASAMTAVGRLEAALDAARRHSEVGGRRHALSGERRAAAGRLRDALDAAWRGLPEGLGHFAAAELGREGATYLLVEVDGPGHPVSYAERLTLTRVRVEGGRALTCGGRDRGAVGAASLVRRAKVPSEVYLWDRAKGASPAQGLWMDVPHRGKAGRETLMPVSGTGLAARHPAFARLEAMAADLLGGRVPEAAEVARLDAAQEALGVEADAIEAAAFAAAEAGVDVAAIEAAHPALVADMTGHDWHHDYADRVIHSAQACEDRIRASLAALPEDAAVALFMRHGRQRWRSVEWFVRPRRAAAPLRVAA